MRYSVILTALLANVAAVSAIISWKDSVSRVSSDKMRKKHLEQKLDKFTTVKNRIKPALSRDNSDTPLFVEMPLDHFSDDPNSETFQNRYFVQDAYYKPGGPVIFHDVGEASVDHFVDGLVDEEEFSVSVAKEFNGLLILFEHRFYGESAPLTSVSEDLYRALPSELSDFYQYLTIEQALEDVVVFASNFTYEFEDWPQQELTPDQAPWVWIGVSYSGARGAWLAKRNPGLFKATLASSAPVQLKVNFWEYFTAAEDALAVNNRNCSADLHAAANWLSDAWINRDASLVDQMIEAVYDDDWYDQLEEYSAPEYEELVWDARRDYMRDASWTAFTDFQYTGVQGGLMGAFCDMMETTYSSEGPEDGVFATESLERAVAAYAGAISEYSIYSQSNSGYVSALRKLGKDKLKTRQFNTGGLDRYLDDYSWFWQVCSEFGAFQVANMSRPENLIPSFINSTFQIQECIDTFGESDQVNMAGPNVDAVNQKYQGWYVELSNTLWTNGEWDPWKALSIDSEEADAPTNDTATTDIPQCGDSLARGTQLRYVISGGYHGSEFNEEVAAGDNLGNIDNILPTNTIGDDLVSRTRRLTSTRIQLTGTPVVDAAKAQSLWISAMSSWLPCTTLDWTYTPAQATTNTPVSSRTPFPTATDSGNTGSDGGNDDDDDSNAGSSIAIPSLLIPLTVSLLAFIIGLIRLH